MVLVPLSTNTYPTVVETKYLTFLRNFFLECEVYQVLKRECNNLLWILSQNAMMEMCSDLRNVQTDSFVYFYINSNKLMSRNLVLWQVLGERTHSSNNLPLWCQRIRFCMWLMIIFPLGFDSWLY